MTVSTHNCASLQTQLTVQIDRTLLKIAKLLALRLVRTEPQLAEDRLFQRSANNAEHQRLPALTVAQEIIPAILAVLSTKC